MYTDMKIGHKSYSLRQMCIVALFTNVLLQILLRSFQVTFPPSVTLLLSVIFLLLLVFIFRFFVLSVVVAVQPEKTVMKSLTVMGVATANDVDMKQKPLTNTLFTIHLSLFCQSCL
eukprot:Lithocolla_globosa_v1_NODE_2014_length_2206_cov_7.820167.p2 type:complete len:116 gc:universal NODE_2014_length_2206_cov_7.820167:487-140(-)